MNTTKPGTPPRRGGATASRTHNPGKTAAITAPTVCPPASLAGQPDSGSGLVRRLARRHRAGLPRHAPAARTPPPGISPSYRNTRVARVPELDTPERVLHRRIGAPEVMATQLEHLLTILPAGDPAALEPAFVVLTAIIGLLTAGYAASLRRAVRHPEGDMSVRLAAEDRNSVSRKGNMPVRSEN